MVGPSETDGVAHDPQSVAVIGGGYVGSPTAAMLAHFGHHVVVAEIDPQRRAQLASGTSPQLEQGLSELLASTLASGRLRVVADAREAVAGAQFVFLCVATPTGSDGRADLSEIDAATEAIRDALAPGAVVVNKSTAPVGTVRRIESILGRSDVSVVSNPEFLSEGSAVHNSFHPARTVVGAHDAGVGARVAQLFSPTGAPVIICEPQSAELIKYAANGFLATKISFVNSIARLCDAVDASIDDVVSALGLDARIGAAYLSPGPGWGGPCLPKDTTALVTMASDAGVELSTVRASITDNDAQVGHICDVVGRMSGGSLYGRSVAALGLSFKARTSDLRASPAVAVCLELARRGATVRAYDPALTRASLTDGLEGVLVVDSLVEAVDGADVVAVLTEWDEFSRIDWGALVGSMSSPRLYDTRAIVDLDAARAAGFTAWSLGRP